MNKITAINTWAVAIFRYGAGIITWRESELKSIDIKTRKNLTMCGDMHPKSDVDRLYLKGKKEVVDLSVWRNVLMGKNSLGFYVEKHRRDVYKRCVCALGTIQTEETMERGELKR